jgi:hypothetical protein
LNLILVLLPCKKIGNKSNEQENRNGKRNSTYNLPGTFIPGKLLKAYLFLFFGFQIFGIGFSRFFGTLL